MRVLVKIIGLLLGGSVPFLIGFGFTVSDELVGLLLVMLAGMASMLCLACWVYLDSTYQAPYEGSHYLEPFMMDDDKPG